MSFFHDHHASQASETPSPMAQAPEQVSQLRRCPLTSGSQAIVLKVECLQPLQPSQLLGVDLLQLVVLWGDGGAAVQG